MSGFYVVALMETCPVLLQFWFGNSFDSPLCCDASCLAVSCRPPPFGASATPSMLEFGIVVLLAVGLLFVLTWWGHRDRREFFLASVLPVIPLASRLCCRRWTLWIHLCVAQVVGQMYGDVTVAVTLPPPLLQTLPCATHCRGTSIDPKNKLVIEISFSSVCRYPVVVSHYLISA